MNDRQPGQARLRDCSRHPAAGKFWRDKPDMRTLSEDQYSIARCCPTVLFSVEWRPPELNPLHFILLLSDMIGKAACSLMMLMTVVSYIGCCPH